MTRYRKFLGIAGAVLLAFVAIQFIPVDRENPPIVAEPNWDSPQTRDLAQRACFDCHSNETVYPWYAKIAPVSFLISHDVEEGREYLNFSEWQGIELDELEEVIQEGEMPPLQYRLIHSDSRLTDEERQTLLDGLLKTASN